jgi:hypothetical protein
MLTYTNKYRGIKFTSQEEFNAKRIIMQSHFISDAWNFLDFCTLFFLLLWSVFRFFFESFEYSRFFLAISAIPLSFALLR